MNPSSLFVDTNGIVYVDNGDQSTRVDRFFDNGTIAEPLVNIYGSCTDLFVDKRQTLYCSIASRHLVIKIDLANCSVTWSHAVGTGCPGPVNTMLNNPHGIFPDDRSGLYVADTYNNRIQYFSSGNLNGKTVAGFGSSTYFILNRPTGILLDADDNLFIADTHNHRIVRSIQGGFKCIIGCLDRSEDTSYELVYPRSIAFDTNGNIAVIDSKNHHIQLFYLTRTAYTDGKFFNSIRSLSIETVQHDQQLRGISSVGTCLRESIRLVL